MLDRGFSSAGDQTSDLSIHSDATLTCAVRATMLAGRGVSNLLLVCPIKYLLALLSCFGRELLRYSYLCSTQRRLGAGFGTERRNGIVVRSVRYDLAELGKRRGTVI